MIRLLFREHLEDRRAQLFTVWVLVVLQLHQNIFFEYLPSFSEDRI